MKERRYAILIGMNEYIEDDNLPYCVKDVDDLSDTLVKRSRFKQEDIHTITNCDTPVKEQIDRAFNEISSTFKKKQDLFFFYFSGHGEYDLDEGNSKLIFGDQTELSIHDVFLRYFVKLTPKNQYLIADACHSGAKVFMKGKGNLEKEIRRLNYNSSELCLMFATESKNVAFQGGTIDNSYFTHFFLEAMNKESLYDDDGLLTMSAIDNYIKKKVVEKSDFVQIPVSETRSSGYKIFCFDEEKISKQVAKPEQKSYQKATGNNSPVNENTSFVEGLSIENRIKIQEQITAIFSKKFATFQKELETQEIRLESINSLDHFDYEDLERVYKHVIQVSRKQKIYPVDGLFEVRKIEKRKPKLNTMFGIMDHLYEESKPEFSYSIDTYSNNMLALGIEIKSQSIAQVNSGIIGMFFQGKFGFSIGILVFNRKWSGTDYTELEFLDFTISPYLLNDFESKRIENSLDNSFKEFAAKCIEWNQKQEKIIESYKQAVKSAQG